MQTWAWEQKWPTAQMHKHQPHTSHNRQAITELLCIYRKHNKTTSVQCMCRPLTYINQATADLALTQKLSVSQCMKKSKKNKKNKTHLRPWACPLSRKKLCKINFLCVFILISQGKHLFFQLSVWAVNFRCTSRTWERFKKVVRQMNPFGNIQNLFIPGEIMFLHLLLKNGILVSTIWLQN